jgi:hypothetical protein
MARVGWLTEHIFRAGLPVWFQAVHPSAWPALRVQFELADNSYFAAQLPANKGEPAFLTYSSVPFEATPARHWQKEFRLRGHQSKKLDHMEASGSVLGAGVLGEKFFASEDWGKLVIMES